MLNNKIIKSMLLVLVIVLSAPSNAASFWRTGKVTRTLSDIAYGQCMVHLDVSVANGCPSSGWVSLDCVGTFAVKEIGERNYATALAASMASKKISVYIDNAKKHNGYCVARRVDMLPN